MGLFFARRLYLIWLLGLQEWRQGAVERVSNSTEDFSFTLLDHAVGGDRFGARGKNVLFNLRNGLGEPIKGGIEMFEIAFSGWKPRDLGAGDVA